MVRFPSKELDSSGCKLARLGGGGPVVQLTGCRPSSKTKVPPSAKMLYQVSQLLCQRTPLTSSD